MPKEPTLSEGWFDRYLEEHGYNPGDPEPDLGVKTRPDRLITRDGNQAVCEIKQFEQDVVSVIARQVRTLSSAEWLSPVRLAVKNAAKQLKPLRENGLPLVVVLANPKGVHVSLDATDVIHALYGDPTWSVEVDKETGTTTAAPEFFAGRNGRLRAFHQYISAVIVLRNRTNEQDYVDELAAEVKARHGRNPQTLEEASEFGEEFLNEVQARRERGIIPEGEYFFVDVIKTVSADATPVSEEFFNGRRDRLWALDANAGGFTRIR